ncbi:MAG: helix-turn-helix transcriptional regulator [Ruminococcus sp.]|nr:helix-turn-helix transcriptional regulator [Ruminococcus sp.]
MYSTQETALKIKEIAKQKGITIKKMLSDCDLNINYISGMAKGKQPTMKNLKKIAVYLDVTTDELLGVTSLKAENQSVSMMTQDEMALEMLKQFNRLSVVDRSRVILYIDDLNRKKA